MFVGRKEELELLKGEYLKNKSSILLFGKRRVGKTTLIKQSLNFFEGKVIYYECIKAPLKENLDNLICHLKKNGFIENYLNFNSISDLFTYISSLNKKVLIVIDEYCYLKTFETSEYIDSLFQNIIDSFDNMHLVLSGSSISTMKSLLENRNALYGRFSLVIDLKELNYLESSLFYEKESVIDKVAFYSVFGGSPFVISQLDYDKGIEYNIKKHILNRYSNINAYIDTVINLDIQSQINSQRVLNVLGNGRKKYNEIEQKLALKTNGLLSKHLNILLDLEIINKVYPINKKEDKKKVFYEINDNLLRFYYAFVYKNKTALELIGIEAFFNLYIKKELKYFISRRFENIVKQYFSLKVKKGLLKDVYDIGVYYYDDPINKRNGEFDCVLKHENTYSIYEIKYLNSKLTNTQVGLEINQIKEIKSITIEKIGFVSVNGFEKIDFDVELIDGNSLYDLNSSFEYSLFDFTNGNKYLKENCEIYECSKSKFDLKR